ncbi:MAG: DUF4221 family protein, partial [Bacteroidaceae bacterium]|nr:DUF4221 family protein [Bacteroidaceae bacterium]
MAVYNVMQNISKCLLLTLVVFASCHSQQGAGIKESSLVETTDTLSFPLEKGTNLFINSMQVYTDDSGKEYLAFRDGYTRPRIFVYEIDNAFAPVRKITFDQEGPNGTGAVSLGFFIRSWDEIYIPNHNIPEISVVDSSGTKKRTYQLAESSSEKIVCTTSLIQRPFIICNGKLFAEQKKNVFNKENFMTSPVSIIVDLDNGTFTPSPFTYQTHHSLPSEKITKSSYNNFCASCYNEERSEIVYAFWLDEHLYKYDIETQKVTKKKVSSRYIPDDESLDPAKRLDSQENDFKEMCEIPFYKFIYYDKYRKVYYRFALPATTCEDNVAFVDFFQAGRNTSSIMVLDEDLNILGETLLPENRFNTTMLFINKDGLWISCNHYLNPGYDEENLQFV